MSNLVWEDTQFLFTNPDKMPGFRLHRLEVFNWGTFNRKVWTLEANGETSLLTGDIGSGKSSLVDAVTTLLVAPQRITYNKAAGAEGKERSLRSYVMGYYKSERSEFGYAAKPVMLREENTYSVILGAFYNEVLGMGVTLAQVFWTKDKSEQPDRFYVVVNRDLGIERDFSRFGNTMPELKKRLVQAGCIVKDSFKEYEAEFCRIFGIRNRQALDLFNQAVSMKSVGNLTQFVREHMLESFDAMTRIDHLIRHFDHLNRAHEAVVKARKQLEFLEPLVADGGSFEQVSKQIDKWQMLHDALPAYFAEVQVKLLTETLQRLRVEAEDLRQKSLNLGDEEAMRRNEILHLYREIEENGGNRLAQIGQEIQRQEQVKEQRTERWSRYTGYLRQLSLGLPQDASDFLRTKDSLVALHQSTDRNLTQLNELDRQLTWEMRDEETRLKPLQLELQSLKHRKSNLPEPQIDIRRRLAQAIGAREEELPFVGELLQVHEEAKDWEGAIERLLHNFGLSLLVPENLYSKVAAWVDKTQLKGRLVYYRVRTDKTLQRPATHPQSVLHKLSLHPQSAFSDWLAHQLASRFNYACTTNLDEFRREPMAITSSGQIKGRDRHEKDDRHALLDRSRYVLGWDNKQKIAALEQQQKKMQAQLSVIEAKIEDATAKKKVFEAQRSIIDKVGEVASDYREVDWGSVAAEIARLQNEKDELEGTSEILKALQKQLIRLKDNLERVLSQAKKITQDEAVNTARIQENEAALLKAKATAEAYAEVRFIFPEIQKLQIEQFHEVKSMSDAGDVEREMRQHITLKSKQDQKDREVLRGKVTAAMARFQAEFPLDSQEMDARLEALGEYRTLLERIHADDLPRFEEKFKNLLHKETIHEIVAFHGQLRKERYLIRERVEQINQSLEAVEYNPGRYIRLNADRNPDREVREFEQQLMACTANTTTGSGDDLYSENKFLQVKAIVERFRGREGFSERDRLWTKKVTDVRNEYTFSASERWRESHEEYEHYTDSGGKSGGQKEKLAYTILAASLAYQFGIDGSNARNFRFVVIDEAFGRGSDESAQFGLELFRHLNLQLLVVTPLQKIHVIDPYVASVGFVHNVEGKDSQLRNVSIGEYRAEREARRT